MLSRSRVCGRLGGSTFALLLTACLADAPPPASRPTPAPDAPAAAPPTDASPEEQAAVAKVIDQIFDAAKSKDVDRIESFHLYGPKFSKFDDDGAGRQDAVVAKKGERDAFTAMTSFDGHAENLKVDVFGNVAVATMMIKYDAVVGKDRVSGAERMTLVLVKDGGRWKVTHEHASASKPAP